MLEKVNFGKRIHHSKVFKKNNIVHLVESIFKIKAVHVIEFVELESRRIGFDIGRNQEKLPNKCLSIKPKVNQNSIVFNANSVCIIMEAKEILRHDLVIFGHVDHDNAL